MMIRDDVFTREFLVHSSIHDDAPQRMRLKVRNPLSAEDLLKQIGRQLIHPMSTMPSLVASRVPIPLGSHLFAFSAEENCFVPIDGKSADSLSDFARLLIHSSSALPSSLPSSVFSQRSSIDDIAQRTSSGYNISSGSHFCRLHQNGSANTFNSSRGRSISNKRFSYEVIKGTPSEQRSNLPPLLSDTMESLIKEEVGDDSDHIMKRKGAPLTMELMLQVTGFLLSEYASRSTEDVIEPTEDNVWSLIEEVLYRNGNITPHSLDPTIVDAFLQTILHGINTGRMHRVAVHKTSFEREIKE